MSCRAQPCVLRLSVFAATFALVSGCGRAWYGVQRDVSNDASVDAGPRDSSMPVPDVWADGFVDTGTDTGVDGGGDGGPSMLPPGMVRVVDPTGVVPPFLIDAYEAAITSGAMGSVVQDQDGDGKLASMLVAIAHALPFDNDGGEAMTALTTVSARSLPGVAPATAISWYQAAAACANAGKRLCTTAEWNVACRGPANTRYTYGSTTHIPGTCNEDVAGVEPTGSRPGCTNPFGVFDMNGNVQEWTEWHPPGLVEYRGGAEDEGPTTSRCDYSNPSWADFRVHPDIGFRCCLR